MNLFSVCYLICVIGVVVYLLILAGRFVRSHEQIADALRAMARKEHDRQP